MCNSFCSATQWWWLMVSHAPGSVLVKVIWSKKQQGRTSSVDNGSKLVAFKMDLPSWSQGCAQWFCTCKTMDNSRNISLAVSIVSHCLALHLHYKKRRFVHQKALDIMAICCTMPWFGKAQLNFYWHFFVFFFLVCEVQVQTGGRGPLQQHLRSCCCVAHSTVPNNFIPVLE
jgi:hypothetical protein